MGAAMFFLRFAVEPMKSFVTILENMSRDAIIAFIYDRGFYHTKIEIQNTNMKSLQHIFVLPYRYYFYHTNTNFYHTHINFYHTNFTIEHIYTNIQHKYIFYNRNINFYNINANFYHTHIYFYNTNMTFWNTYLQIYHINMELLNFATSDTP